MRLSQLFTKTRKEVPGDEESVNAQLLIRAGFVHKELAGAYSFLPLGLRVLNNIIGIIREEMNAIGGQEVFLSSLQNPELWKKSKRWDDKVVDIWFKTTLKSGGEVGLANTHEEPLTELMKNHVSSYKDLPVFPYQFQTKFRNELRAKGGLLRTREFVMKDLYSFSRSQEEHNEFYEKAKQAYFNVFERVGLKKHTVLTFASGGSFSKYSHEFQTLCSAGEDIIFLCKKCNVAVNREIVKEVNACPECKNTELQEEKAIEVGNIFSLGTRFSEALKLEFTDEKGAKQPVIMGSYGIGPARVMGTIIEVFHDEKGVVWPETISPFALHMVSLEGGEKDAEKLYEEFSKKNVEVLYDDRKEASPGEKLADADLMGIPLRVVASKKTTEQKKVELKKRSEETATLISFGELEKTLGV
ncbi:MAG: prolyl-tRNA synthetase [Candidatus Wildermuthbacteria bacterium RIFCSPHIGHO2_01_FULL_48_25]|uniref:Proline--tRNA ligase n=1 Tax=Candidatus Wildermuthbacteria bacterium RIFCSPLOWO2_01_FULL_48_16 TaxID=1802461 RepID=A0A1G2RKR3_9BACT|nr:MAG: prolyl-tRNA synthetase [Candidatus Wildermuthbacteria bacterium RIFCSPHIGHO2_01_FULL_48_25]OHA69272.1 MAG: prolyl-tRNA synthetase [Candidatus Wildermuthbacteria bacterium RIFCSPHIGHO2_02_FULL_49_12b]OHA73433.1 MAG: prolyl-tRNA synthetase [Candidatus Wildermuthbacteria bacterium RIFCSPLOWO2_01_FULL_48_16]